MREAKVLEKLRLSPGLSEPWFLADRISIKILLIKLLKPQIYQALFKDGY